MKLRASHRLLLESSDQRGHILSPDPLQILRSHISAVLNLEIHALAALEFEDQPVAVRHLVECCINVVMVVWTLDFIGIPPHDGDGCCLGQGCEVAEQLRDDFADKRNKLREGKTGGEVDESEVHIRLGQTW